MVETIFNQTKSFYYLKANHGYPGANRHTTCLCTVACFSSDFTPFFPDDIQPLYSDDFEHRRVIQSECSIAIMPSHPFALSSFCLSVCLSFFVTFTLIDKICCTVSLDFTVSVHSIFWCRIHSQYLKSFQCLCFLICFKSL